MKIFAKNIVLLCFIVIFILTFFVGSRAQTWDYRQHQAEVGLFFNFYGTGDDG